MIAPTTPHTILRNDTTNETEKNNRNRFASFFAPSFPFQGRAARPTWNFVFRQNFGLEKLKGKSKEDQAKTKINCRTTRTAVPRSEDEKKTETNDQRIKGYLILAREEAAMSEVVQLDAGLHQCLRRRLQYVQDNQVKHGERNKQKTKKASQTNKTTTNQQTTMSELG